MSAGGHRTSTPAASSSTARRSAWRQQRSMASPTPALPRLARIAHTGIARAPCDIWRPRFIGLRPPSPLAYAAFVPIDVASAVGSATATTPQSYGVLSHLWPSVAHESARSTPSSRCRRFGAALAHRPKAPSTWTHVDAGSNRSMMVAKGSLWPVLTLPAWSRTSVGRSDSSTADGMASGRARPKSSVAIACTDPTPRPASRSALSADEWISADATISIGGAPMSPSVAVSQPTRRSRASRAVMIAVRFAIEAPGQKAATVSVGSPSRSTIHSAARVSRCAATGDITGSAAF